MEDLENLGQCLNFLQGMGIYSCQRFTLFSDAEITNGPCHYSTLIFKYLQYLKYFKFIKSNDKGIFVNAAKAGLKF